METSHDAQMSALLYQQQARALTEIERAKLKLYMEVYEIGQVRKAQALVQTVKRGLREPLNHANQ